MGRTLQWNSLIVCLVNFLAIIGMANVQARAVECVGLQVSPLIGGMIDAFLGKSGGANHGHPVLTCGSAGGAESQFDGILTLVFALGVGAVHPHRRL